MSAQRGAIAAQSNGIVVRENCFIIIPLGLDAKYGILKYIRVSMNFFKMIFSEKIENRSRVNESGFF